MRQESFLETGSWNFKRKNLIKKLERNQIFQEKTSPEDQTPFQWIL